MSRLTTGPRAREGLGALRLGLGFAGPDRKLAAMPANKLRPPVFEPGLATRSSVAWYPIWCQDR
jgi:hypothetical protein